MKARLCLNCLPGFSGKVEKQQFIIKIYTILLFQILITIGIVLITLTSTSKFHILTLL